MKKIVIFSIAFLFFLNFCKAREDTIQIKKNQLLIISLSGGFSIPTGDFSYFQKKEKVSLGIAGYPELGFNGKLQVDYYFSKVFGVNLLFYSSHFNGVEPDSSDLFYDPHPYDHGLGGGSVLISYEYSTGDWKTSGFLGGITTRICRANPAVNFRFNVGVINVTRPETIVHSVGYDWILSGQITPWDNVYTEHQMTSSSTAFDLGTDVTFSLNKKFSAGFSIDYFTTNADFNGEVTSNGNKIEGVKFTKKITEVNINFGITYNIL